MSKLILVPNRNRDSSLRDSSTRDSSLVATKLCKNIARSQGKPLGKYGVCKRDHCTFAHSLEELRIPDCAFGNECYRRNGTRDRNTGVIDRENKCNFKHPDENNEQYYKRTGKDLPDAPKTSTETRPTQQGGQSPGRDTPQSDTVNLSVPRSVVVSAIEALVNQGVKKINVNIT